MALSDGSNEPSCTYVCTVFGKIEIVYKVNNVVGLIRIDTYVGVQRS